MPKITGKIMIQFDDEAPSHLVDIKDFEEYNLTLGQTNPKVGPTGNHVGHEFSNVDGSKRFKIFIEKT